MSRVAAVGIVFLLFLAGVIVGVVGTHAFYIHHVREPAQLIDLGARWHVQKLRRELDLTPRQEEEIRRLVRRTHGEIREIRDDTMPRVRDRIAAAHHEFLDTLEPEQRRRFQELMRRQGPRYLRAFGFPVEAGARRGFHGHGEGHGYGHLRRGDGGAAEEAETVPSASGPSDARDSGAADIGSPPS